MRPYRIHFDRGSRLWTLRCDGVVVETPRLILDAPALTDGQHLVATGHISGNAEETHLYDNAPLLGRRKDDDMREWCVGFDEGTARWVIYRQDVYDVLVTTTNLELDCHAITTSDGVIHCLAEMLLDGTTNRRSSVNDAAKVKLRTLCIYDQVVEVPLIKADFVVKPPVG